MDVAKTKEAFRRRARAGIPFNPVTGTEYSGGNLVRMQALMKKYGSTDPRFITPEEGAANGWHVQEQKPGAGIAPYPDVEMRVLVSGKLHEVPLYHASRVEGMPSLDEMLALEAEQFAQMMGQAPKPAPQQEAAPEPVSATPQAGVEPNASGIEGVDMVTVGPAALAQQQAPAAVAAAQADTDLEDEEVTIGPAPHQQEKASPEATAEREEGPAAQQATEQPRQASAQGRETEKPSGDLAVMASYFLDGLHNFDGIEIAKQVNRLIAAQQLQKDRKAIEVLLSSFPNARRLGVEIVTAERLRDDRLFKANPSEPATLLDGALARDKEGAYRPAAGGLAVLQDKGTALVLKNRSENAFRGAMELAKAKGWAAIELKGKPKMLAQAWVEAKLMGLEVVNYKPTEQDRERLAARMAQEAQRRETQAGKGAAPQPEIVEVHPVVDAAGRQKTATVTQRVEEPVQAQAANDHGAEPVSAVARTVTRFEGTVREDVTASAVGHVEALGAAPLTGASTATAVAAQQVAQAVSVSNEASKAADAAGTLDAAVLLKHGPAPYDNLPSNRLSYFATLRDTAGVERTIWGVDLARSFSEAGAELGDTISLQEKGRQPVTVEGPLPDGGVGPKTAHRVRWETAVLTKGSELVPAVETVATGLHVGPIMKIEGGLVGQKAGRDPDKLAWHDAARLTGGVPAVGDWAEITYSNGAGTVKVRGQEQAQGIAR